MRVSSICAELCVSVCPWISHVNWHMQRRFTVACVDFATKHPIASHVQLQWLLGGIMEYCQSLKSCTGDSVVSVICSRAFLKWLFLGSLLICVVNIWPIVFQETASSPSGEGDDFKATLCVFTFTCTQSHSWGSVAQLHTWSPSVVAYLILFFLPLPPSSINQMMSSKTRKCN